MPTSGSAAATLIAGALALTIVPVQSPTTQTPPKTKVLCGMTIVSPPDNPNYRYEIREITPPSTGPEDTANALEARAHQTCERTVEIPQSGWTGPVPLPHRTMPPAKPDAKPKAPLFTPGTPFPPAAK